MTTFVKMARFCFILTLTWLDHSALGQTTRPFDISETFQDSAGMKTAASVQSTDSLFFSDDKYIAGRTCSGEWGGTVWFKSKKTGIKYACAASCPVCINKLRGKYYVTTTLAHLRGFSKVLEIDNPAAMRMFKQSKLNPKKGQLVVRHFGDDESNSTKGVKVLADSMGMLTLCSFPYQNELYYVTTDNQKTFLSKIVNRQFETIDTISQASIWTYYPSVIRTTDNHYLFFFENSDTKGYLDIVSNKVALFRKKP